MAQLALKLVDSRHSSTSFFVITVKHSSERASERDSSTRVGMKRERDRSVHIRQHFIFRFSHVFGRFRRHDGRIL